MREKKRALMPENHWNSGVMESWLEDMAAQGWMVEECGSRIARFHREEPAKVRFRLEPFPKAETYEARQEREEVYRQLGWETAAFLRNYQVYVCRDPAAPELETDPVAAGWAWDRMLRKERRSLLLAWLFLVGCVAFAACRILSSDRPVMNFLLKANTGMFLGALLVPWLVWDTVRTLRKLRYLRRQLAAGLPRPHTWDWRRCRRGTVLGLALFMLMESVFLLYPFTRIGASWGADLDELTKPVPCLLGEQLDPGLTAADRESGVCLMNPTFLVPGHYDVWDWFTGERSVISQCEILRIPALAEPLYEEWLDHFDGMTFTELDCPGFDRLALARDGGNARLLAWQGRVVLSVGTYGVDGLEDHIDDYAAVLAEFQ